MSSGPMFDLDLYGDDHGEPVSTGAAGTMLSEAAIRDWLREQERSRAGWQEPDGWLVPTEPDPEERERTRLGLDSQILTLRRVLGLPDGG